MFKKIIGGLMTAAVLFASNGVEATRVSLTLDEAIELAL